MVFKPIRREKKIALPRAPVFTFTTFRRHPYADWLALVSFIQLSRWGLRALLKGSEVAAWQWLCNQKSNTLTAKPMLAVYDWKLLNDCTSDHCFLKIEINNLPSCMPKSYIFTAHWHRWAFLREVLEKEMGSQHCCVLWVNKISDWAGCGVWVKFFCFCKLQCAWQNQKGKMHKGRGDQCWQASHGQREVKTGHVVARLLCLSLSK